MYMFTRVMLLVPMVMEMACCSMGGRTWERYDKILDGLVNYKRYSSTYSSLLSVVSHYTMAWRGDVIQVRHFCLLKSSYHYVVSVNINISCKLHLRPLQLNCRILSGESTAFVGSSALSKACE